VVAEPSKWREFARAWPREQEVPGQFAMLVAGPSTRHPEANHRIEIMRVGGPGGASNAAGAMVRSEIAAGMDA
jgi:hypothetical protein